MGLDFNLGDAALFSIGRPEPYLYRQFKKGNGYNPGGPGAVNPVTADQISLADPLKSSFGQINNNQQGNLADALGTLKTGATKSQIASGRVQGDYTGQVLGRAKNMASRNIADTIGNRLGATSLKDFQNQKEFEQNMALAREIGSLNAPSLIQQILGGANSAVQGAGEFKGLYDALGKRGSTNSNPYRETSPSLNYYDPGSSGYSRYQ